MCHQLKNNYFSLYIDLINCCKVFNIYSYVLKENLTNITYTKRDNTRETSRIALTIAILEVVGEGLPLSPKKNEFY